MAQIRNHHPKSEVLIQSETALNAGERGSFDGSIGSNTSKRTQRCTIFLDTRTSSRQRLQYQEGTELRKYWKDANHCFSTIMMFKWQDGCPTNGSHIPLKDEGKTLMVDLVKGSADPIRIQRPEVRDTSTETETDSCQC